MRLLGGREHSRTELERKLAKHEDEPGQLARVLDDLQAKGFISEERVVESVLHRRAARLGAGRIRQELQAKGLDPELVRRAIESVRATETQRAREVWLARFGEPPSDRQEYARHMRFLLARGFDVEAARRAIGDQSSD